MNSERQIRKYIAAVKRRLNLPKDIRQRLLSDLQTTITARLEQGESWEAVKASLGTPKAAAAELTEQMKEFAYGKSPWRFVFLAAAIYGAWELLSSLFVWLSYLMLRDPFLTQGEAASIGIIGGADGPTAIFVTGPVWTQYLPAILMLIVGVCGFLRLRKCRQK